MDELAGATARLTPEQSKFLLARLSFELTIIARDTYALDADLVGAPALLRAFNEIQHRILSCLLGLMSDRTHDIWIWPALWEFSERADCTDQVIRACVRALKSVPR